MRHALPAGVKRAERVLHLAVRLGGSTVLPQMLRPRFDQVTLDTAVRVRGVYKQLPEHGSVAPANRSHQPAQCRRERGALVRLERVFDGNQHRPRIGRKGFRHHGVVPDARWVQIHAFGGGQTKARNQAESQEQTAAGRRQGPCDTGPVRHDPPQQRADRERPEQREARYRERATTYPLRRPTLRRENQDRKSTRLNSSHMSISYAVFCLKKKKKNINRLNIFRKQKKKDKNTKNKQEN